MMIRKIFIFLCLLIATPTYAINPKINSTTIIKNTLAALPNCLHYQMPTHFCVWASELGIVNTTPIVSHYLPDLVVSVFKTPNDNPWFEANKIADQAGKSIQNGIVKNLTQIAAGSGNHSLQDVHEQAVIFKEADVIGNPALALIPKHGLLPSTAHPWKPYYQSMADSLLWRGLPPTALPEEGIAIALNVTHHIGTSFANWGGIYPHEGKVINDNDAKASAVIAARAADLVTNKNEYGHVYRSLSTDCGEHCSAAAIQENSKETYFQMIYPITQTQCHILGESDSYNASMINSEGAYVWIVWRHYEGCVDGDGKYLGRT